MGEVQNLKAPPIRLTRGWPPTKGELRKPPLIPGNNPFRPLTQVKRTPQKRDKKGIITKKIN